MTTTTNHADALSTLVALGAPITPRLLEDTFGVREAPQTFTFRCACHPSLKVDQFPAVDAFGLIPEPCRWFADTTDLWRLSKGDGATADRLARHLPATGSPMLVREDGMFQMGRVDATRWAIDEVEWSAAVWVEAHLIGHHATVGHLDDYRLDLWEHRLLTAIRITWLGRVQWYVVTPHATEGQGPVVGHPSEVGLSMWASRRDIAVSANRIAAGNR